MADTGAPWNLPYPLATDLVRDGAQAIQDLAEASADGLDAAGGLVAVKQTFHSEPRTGTIAATPLDYTELEVKITPQSTQHKVLLIAQINFGEFTDNSAMNWAFTRDSTLIGVGDAAGSRSRSSSGSLQGGGGRSEGHISSTSAVFLDSPNTDTEITYGILLQRGYSDSATVTYYINRSREDDNAATRSRYGSSLTVLEVKV